MKTKTSIIRIKDIAEKAEVSVGTVDRVLHNRGRVSEEVREKVKKIIKELKYEPNIIARTLGTNKSYQISALIPDPEKDEYWKECKNGIEKAYSEFKGYGITIDFYYFDLHKISSFLQKANEVTESHPDAILIAPLFFRESLGFFSEWNNLNIPFITINTQITESGSLSYIGQDSYQSGKVAAKLLHYGIAEAASFVIIHIEENIANSAHLIKKEQGFKDYFDQLEESENKYKVITADLPNPEHVSFFENLDYLLAENPEIRGAFVTTSKAFEIAKYFEKRGIREIRLVGFDLLTKNIHYLRKGTIDFLINQNPKGQGYWGIVHLTEKVAFKKEIVPEKLLPLDIITLENLNYYFDI